MTRLAALLLLVACAPTEEGVMCAEYAASSVSLSVVGPDGAPLVATITATDEDGAAVQVDCVGGGAAETCTEWTVGWEVDGEITIVASAYDGCNYGEGSVVVDVPLTEDGCHVVPQEATLTVDEWTDLDCGEG